MTPDATPSHRRDCTGEEKCWGPWEQVARPPERFLIDDLEGDTEGLLLNCRRQGWEGRPICRVTTLGAREVLIGRSPRLESNEAKS